MRLRSAVTFLELILTVVVLLTIVGLSFPKLSKTVRGNEFVSFVKSLHAVLDFCQNRAVLTAKKLEVEVDQDNDTIELVCSENSCLRQNKFIENKPGFDFESDIKKIVFFPDGVVTNFNLKVFSKEKKAEIFLDTSSNKIVLKIGNES